MEMQFSAAAYQYDDVACDNWSLDAGALVLRVLLVLFWVFILVVD